MDINTILSLVEYAISQEPKIADSLKKLFTVKDPTAADWQAERDLVAGLTYENLVPDSGVAPGTPTPPPSKPPLEPPVFGGPS